MKKAILVAVAFWSCLSSSMAALIWQIGLDNAGTEATEMDPEYQADDFFYLHAGDYSSLRGYTGISTLAYAVDRTVTGAEIFADGSVTGEGFERALTSDDVATNIFFQLTAADLEEGGLKFTVDFLKPALWANPPAPTPVPDALTDVSVYFNGVLIGSIENMSSASLYDFSFNNSLVSAVEGSNVISLVRTGESVPSGWVSSYVVMDYLKLETAPEPSRTLFCLVALGCCLLRRRRV